MKNERRARAGLSGWAISLMIHVGLALIAAISAIGVHAGQSSEGASFGLRWDFYRASVKSNDPEPVSGAPIPDPVQYGRLNSSETPIEPISDEPVRLEFPAPKEDAAPAAEAPELRPARAADRTRKLPPASDR